MDKNVAVRQVQQNFDQRFGAAAAGGYPNIFEIRGGDQNRFFRPKKSVLHDGPVQLEILKQIHPCRHYSHSSGKYNNIDEAPAHY